MKNVRLTEANMTKNIRVRDTVCHYDKTATQAGYYGYRTELVRVAR